jgi:hypothetical protein
MTISEFTIKQHDTSEALTAVLNDSVDTAFSLTGCTVVFSMRSFKTGLIQVNRASVTIVNAATRTVKYVWLVGDTALDGKFNAEFEVTFSDGKILTFPNGNIGIFVHITPQIA